MQTEPAIRFQAGDRVALISTGERGIVVHAWKSHDLDGEDECYVAFFGDQLPDAGQAPSQTPYLLKYAATSLQHLS